MDMKQIKYSKSIDLYFARDEKAIEETDTKYGKLCFMLRMLVDRINIKQKNASGIAAGIFFGLLTKETIRI